MRIIAVFLTLLLLAACAGKPVVKLYEGADKPTSQLLVVRVPMELEILMINDKAVEGAAQVFTYGNRELHLAPGRYRILAFYKNLFQINADEHEIIKSDPAEFTVDGKAGEIYQIGFDKPADLEAAQAMADGFRGWVRNEQTGEQVPGEESALVLNRGFVSVLTGAAAVTEANANSVAPESGSATPAAPPAAEAPAAPADSGYLDLLKAHWNQATAEERRAFLQWISATPAPAP
ncbi:MAG: DUF2057 family protein [Alcanivoracaceae bacterium]|nr:DUF2057 family protein [Alcanivoracaceae bacterium]